LIPDVFRGYFIKWMTTSSPKCRFHACNHKYIVCRRGDKRARFSKALHQAKGKIRRPAPQ
jgi:hypothetical protein